MRKLSYLARIALIFVLFAACKQPTRDIATLSAKELEVVEFVLRLSYDRRYPAGILNFLTTTPMPNSRREWKWKDLPDDFHQRISDLPVHFGKASEAYMDGGECVRQKGTHFDGYMHWVSITRWLSDEEVEVDTGRWSRQLHGAGTTYLLQKRSGKWSVKKCLRMWVT